MLTDAPSWLFETRIDQVSLVSIPRVLRPWRGEGTRLQQIVIIRKIRQLFFAATGAGHYFLRTPSPGPEAAGQACPMGIATTQVEIDLLMSDIMRKLYRHDVIAPIWPGPLRRSWKHPEAC